MPRSLAKDYQIENTLFIYKFIPVFLHENSVDIYFRYLIKNDIVYRVTI